MSMSFLRKGQSSAAAYLYAGNSPIAVLAKCYHLSPELCGRSDDQRSWCIIELVMSPAHLLPQPRPSCSDSVHWCCGIDAEHKLKVCLQQAMVSLVAEKNGPSRQMLMCWRRCMLDTRMLDHTVNRCKRFLERSIINSRA